MLSTNDVFDRDVKQVLSEVKGDEIPLDFMVDIEQRLDQLEKKKKRRVFVWFFTGIALASGLTFGLLRENGTSNNPLKTAPQKVTNQTTKTKVFKQIASPEENKSNQVNTVQIATTQLSGVTRNILSNSPIKETVIRSTGGNHSDLMQTATPVESIATVQTQKAIIETNKDAPVLLSNRKTEVLPSSDSVKAESSIKNELAKEELSTSIKLPEIVMKNDLPKWTHSFGFYTGMSGVISSFQTDDQALTATVGATNALKYRELRSTQERATSSIDLSLRYRVNREHLVLQTGVDFFEWGEQLMYDYTIVYDGVNRYSYFSIPFYLGYRQAWGKVELTASAGSSIGHVLKRDGYYLQPDLTTVAIEQASTWTSTGYVQIALSYTIDKFRFSLAPTYRKSFAPVVQSTFTKNTYQSIGLQMGIAMILK
jgi:hypothetical protein